MNKSRLTAFLFSGLAATILLAGCDDDFFVRPPDHMLAEERFFESSDDLRRITAPLYNVHWFDFVNGPMTDLLDARAGLISTRDNRMAASVMLQETGAHPSIEEGWGALYNLIIQSNVIIRGIQREDSDAISQVEKMHRIAEARFMRGMAYLYLAKLWGDVPILPEDVNELVDESRIRRNLRSDVLEFARRDFEFAMEFMVMEDTRTGRLDHWAAQAMLARTYLTRAYFESNGGSLVMDDLNRARNLSFDIIVNSHYRLEETYRDVFESNDTELEETIFALQWTVDDEFLGSGNPLQTRLAHDSRITGSPVMGEHTHPSAFLVELFGYPDAIDARRRLTFMVKGDSYPELLSSEGGYQHTLGGERSTAIRKHIVGNSEDTGGRVSFLATEQPTALVRLSDVFLTYSQSVLGDQDQTFDTRAVFYFNRIRERAGLERMNRFSYEDLIHERMREFAFEGRAWFDLVRYYEFRPQEAIAFINNQNRQAFVTIDPEEPAGYVISDPGQSPGIGAEVFRLPLPASDVAYNPLLQDEPIPYDFGDSDE